MIETVAGDIFKCLHNVLPDGWERIALYAQVADGAYTIFAFANIDGGFYDLEELSEKYDIDPNDLIDAYYHIYCICIANKQRDWDSYTMTIEKSGAFSVDYVYTDQLVDIEAWIAKYSGATQ